jgi:hypothetical protein
MFSGDQALYSYSLVIMFLLLEVGACGSLQCYGLHQSSFNRPSSERMIPLPFLVLGSGIGMRIFLFRCNNLCTECFDEARCHCMMYAGRDFVVAVCSSDAELCFIACFLPCTWVGNRSVDLFVLV